MRLISKAMFAAILAAAVAASVLALPALGQDGGNGTSTTNTDSGGKTALRIGWQQDPRTLNPFVGLDEEDWNIWSINYDLLVNFSPDDLSPAPGIAKTWDVSEDKKTVTFHLDPDKIWSDGKPVTSADVKWSLDVLGKNGAGFTGYTSNVSSIETPDAETVVIKTKRPDARLVGGLYVYILPKHVWDKVPVSQLTGSYQPPLPMVGSGPFVATEFSHGHIVTMSKNPYWKGPQPSFDQIQFIKYGNQDAVERALQLGEIDMIREVEASGYDRLKAEPNIDAISAPSPSYTQLAFNLCSKQDCPNAEFNPAVQDPAVRQALAYAIDRDRINQIAAHGTSFVAHGVLPSYYRDFYSEPSQDYPFDPEKAKQILDDAGWQDNGSDPRTKDGEKLEFNLLARTESPYTQAAAKLIAEEAAAVGIKFNVQVVSDDRLTDVTTRTVDGKPAPDFDTFIWGWGGDPYDPSFILSVLKGSEIGNLSDSFWNNPEYDRLWNEQAGEFDVAQRKETIGKMVALAQQDLPYIVLTYDPSLQAYRTDRLAGVERVCPRGADGDLICDEVSYEPFLTIHPASGASDSSTKSGGAGVIIGIIAAIVVIGGGFLFWRSRRNRGGGGDGDLEFEE